MEKVSKHIPTAICVPCFDFTPDGHQRFKKTVIIAPIVLEEVSAAKLQIAWACSRGRFCFDEECVYAHGWDSG